jgi:hypothetical protein
MSTLRILAVVAFAVCCAACAQNSYYKVTDPGSGKVFYTEEIKRNGSAVEFQDAQTNSVVTLQNSEIAAVPEATYKEAVGKAKKSSS